MGRYSSLPRATMMATALPALIHAEVISRDGALVTILETGESVLGEGRKNR